MLWALFGLLALIAMVVLSSPLRNRGEDLPNRDDGAIAILSDQLREVEADAERGLISPEEARAAQTEIKRRLLSVHRNTGATAAKATNQGTWLILAFIVLVPLAGAGIYAGLGNPNVPSIAFADRAQERQGNAEIVALAQKLRDRLLEDENGGPSGGWMLLGQTYMRMGRYEEAADAFETVAIRPDATSAVLSQFAEALIAAENGIVTPKAEGAIDQAMDMDPTNPAASYYKAVALDQGGDSVAAYEVLVARIEQEQELAPWMEAFAAEANRIGSSQGLQPVDLSGFAPPAPQGAAPGPSAEDVEAAAAMSEDDRAAFIRSMVERLASRLDEEPGDLDGWIRLGNAYAVLGETENAGAAFGRAAELTADLPQDDPRKAAVQQALKKLGL